MTIAEYTTVLERLTSSYADPIRTELYVRGGNFLLANIKNRIQRAGQDTKQRLLLPYSTKEMYVERDQFVKKGAFKPIGKNGTQKTKVFDIRTKKTRNIAITSEFRERKSMYLANGYKQLRDIQGMPTNIKNLTYSGSTMLAFVLGRSGNTILIGFNQKKAAEIRKYQEQLNGGPIFSATTKEITEFQQYIVKAEIEIITRLYTP